MLLCSAGRRPSVTRLSASCATPLALVCACLPEGSSRHCRRLPDPSQYRKRESGSLSLWERVRVRGYGVVLLRPLPSPLPKERKQIQEDNAKSKKAKIKREHLTSPALLSPFTSTFLLLLLFAASFDRISSALPGRQTTQQSCCVIESLCF